MSMFFGIFNRNGKPVEKIDLDKMYSSIQNFPHKSCNYKIINNIGFAHLLTYNTPESIYENQPIFLEDQQIVFVFKGRIDNRNELADLLNIYINNKTPDSEIVLQSWMKFGEKSFDKILGDWAFAIFDFKTQELFISRDHHGYTSINYYIDNDKIIFSSSIKPIIKIINPEINEKSLISLLSIYNDQSLNTTFYKNIYRLNPAHYIKMDKYNFTNLRYWYPENIEINYNKKLNEYSEELFYIFNQSVKDRLRSHKPVSSALSGGLDSGSVSYVAADLLKRENKKLTTYSHIPLFDISNKIDGDRIGDEKPFIDETIKASGNINPIYLTSENISVLEGITQSFKLFNQPVHAACNTYWILNIIQNVTKDEVGTFLTGEHGNATISYTGWEDGLSVNDLYNVIGLKRIIKRKIFKPIVKKLSYETYLKLTGNQNNVLEKFSYLKPEIVFELKKEMKNNNYIMMFDHAYKSSQEAILSFFKYAIPRTYTGANIGDYYGIELRDPTADKRVIEYMLSIPNSVFYSKSGDNKQIIKSMMYKKLPDKVLFAKKKGLQSSDLGLKINQDKDAINESINNLCKSDYVNSIIDTRKLKTDWIENTSTKSNDYNVYNLQHILRAVMAGEFMLSFDKL